MDVLEYVRWARANTNASLKGQEDIRRACGYSAFSGIPRHPDIPKTWDNMLAVHHAIATTPTDRYVLDAGGCRDSVFLESLKRKGYTKLVNVNLDETTPEDKNGVSWQRGDITGLDGTEPKLYSFVACLSVIEHGVDLHKFFVEMARIIAHDGYMFVSTDYWTTPIDARGQQAFGAPVHVFSFDEVWDMIQVAQKVGFALEGTALDMTCRDAPINWLGMDYTFVNMLFRRR